MEALIAVNGNGSTEGEIYEERKMDSSLLLLSSSLFTIEL